LTPGSASAVDPPGAVKADDRTAVSQAILPRKLMNLMKVRWIQWKRMKITVFITVGFTAFVKLPA